MKPRIFVSRPIPDKAIERLAAHCDVQIHFADAALKPAQLGEACREMAGLLCVGVRVNDEVLSQAPHLKVAHEAADLFV